MKTLFFCGFILAAVMGIAREVFADRVYMKSGARFEGYVIDETPQTITVQIDVGKVTLDRAEIRHIEKAPVSIWDQAGEGGLPASGLAVGSDSTGKSPEDVSKAPWVWKTRQWLEEKLGVPLTRPVLVLLVWSILSIPLTIFLFLRALRPSG